MVQVQLGLIFIFTWMWLGCNAGNEQLVKPRFVPHNVTNDIYMDPCKAKAFIGDIALTEAEYIQYEQRIGRSNQTLFTLLRNRNFTKPLVNIILEELTSMQIWLDPYDVQNNRKLRNRLTTCLRKYQTKRHRKHGKRRFEICVERRIARWMKHRKHSRHSALRERHRRAATARPERLWEFGIIPYEIQANFSGNHKAMFKLAMRHWENYTCITFVEKQAHHQNYIVFTERSCGCCSFVGKRGNGAQAVSIGKNCDKFGIVVHELGHVIGFWHEHTRPDRDEHVQIVYKNIQPGQEYNFNKLTENEVNSLGEEYDFGSIMHYARNTFARAIFLDTILPQRKPGSVVRPEIGQRVRLSPGDIRQANKLYKCAKCGRTLQDSKASFHYRPETSNHNRDEMCEWRISATHGEKIILKLTVIDIPDSGNCELDYLEVRDGYYPRSKLLGKYCGVQKVPLALISSDSRMWLAFKSTRGRGQGFSAEYEAVCGGEIIKEHGHLTSPNYPDDYKSHKECIWKISVPNNYQVALNFQSFEIENHDNCVYDYLEIRDGHSIKSPLLGRYCGYKTPEDVKSTKNEMYVKFVSDSSVQKRGFAATFVKEYDECTTETHGCDHICVNTLGSFKCECNIGYELHSDGKKCEDACGGYIDTTNGTLQTPSYPDFYPPNKNCVWQIVAPEQYRITLNFTHFDLEGNNQDCEYDSVEVRSGMGKHATVNEVHCGSTTPPPITSDGNTLRIEFNSDNSVQKTGFNAIFFIDKDECSVENGGCQHICENTMGSYRCSCHNGFTLHSNQHYCKEGGCQYVIKEVQGAFKSLNWPEQYPSRKNCAWSFSCKPGHLIRLVFTEFQLEMHQECTYDHVQVYDGSNRNARTLGRFCGSKIPPPITSTSNMLYVTFESDASVQRKGFYATHSTVCGAILKAASTVQMFYSHAKYGDQNYGNREDCEWKIQAQASYVVKLNFKELHIEEDTECGYDLVEVYDGKDSSSLLIGQYCGTNLPTEITSSQESLLVVFKSDDTINAKGFKATYYMAKTNTFTEPREMGIVDEIVISNT